jgi:hypothetical protein
MHKKEESYECCGGLVRTSLQISDLCLVQQVELQIADCRDRNVQNRLVRVSPTRTSRQISVQVRRVQVNSAGTVYYKIQMSRSYMKLSNLYLAVLQLSRSSSNVVRTCCIVRQWQI